MPKICLVYHSGYGHTKKVAETIAEAIRHDGGVDFDLLTAEEAGDDLDRVGSADLMIWGCPTYMGGPSADFKKFIDATSGPWMKQAWAGKAAMGFSNSGSLSGDKQGTLLALVTLACQHGMMWVPMGIPGPNKESGHGGKPDDVNRVGAYIGLMTQSDNADPSETPSPGDLETARKFGRNAVDAAKRLFG